MRTLRAILVGAAMIFAASLSSSCGRCSGVVECVQPASVSIDGRIVEATNETSISGATVRLVGRVGGGFDSATTTSNADGSFQARIGATSVGADTVAVRVSAPGYPPYTIPALPCRASDVRGDGCILGVIVANPYFPQFGRFYYRGASGTEAGPVSGATITFHRTSGAGLIGVSNDTYQATTGSDGRVPLFGLFGIFANGFSPVIGDLTVQASLASVRHGFALYPSFVRQNASDIPLGVGPNLDYGFYFVDSTTGKPLPGVQLQFQQTSGLGISPTSFTGTSDRFGAVHLPWTTGSFGSFVGQVIIAPPTGAATVFSGLTFTAFDADTARIYAKYLVGAGGKLRSIPIDSLKP